MDNATAGNKKVVNPANGYIVYNNWRCLQSLATVGRQTLSPKKLVQFMLKANKVGTKDSPEEAPFKDSSQRNERPRSRPIWNKTEPICESKISDFKSISHLGKVMVNKEEEHKRLQQQKAPTPQRLQISQSVQSRIKSQVSSGIKSRMTSNRKQGNSQEKSIVDAPKANDQKLVIYNEWRMKNKFEACEKFWLIL